MNDNKKNGLELLREPFPKNQIGFLPKGSKAQMSCPAAEKKNCKVCGGWHHPKLVHLSFVGHAALTDRLLDCDLKWAWQPLALDENGLPLFDEDGGLWIKLTVCGQTRLGYGNAEKSQYKEIGSRKKEVIGDALRNAAMRFGAALELWHKGKLHPPREPAEVPPPKVDLYKTFLLRVNSFKTLEELQGWYNQNWDIVKKSLTPEQLEKAEKYYDSLKKNMLNA